MLFEKRLWPGLKNGSITLAFRRWRRPTVKTGGTLRCPAGTLRIRAVERTALARLSAEDARSAGFPTLAALRETLRGRPGELYRIAFELEGEDERPLLRADDSPAAVEDARARLDALDRRSTRGAWTRAVLALIRDHPGTRAPDLAARLRIETVVFKRDVRKLKALGLTESLRVGYRISPRGAALLASEPR